MIFNPTPWFIKSSLVALPAPRCIASIPNFSEWSTSTLPSLSAFISVINLDLGNKEVSSSIAVLPPCALTISLNFSKALPEFTASISIFLASSLVCVILPWISIISPACIQSSVKSLGPLPFNVSIASIISKELPIAFPSGWFISVIIAIVFLPRLLPIFIISFASSVASSTLCINAPSPYLTSKSIVSDPDANFLDIIDEAISGIEFTVPVTSLRAYNFLSAGTKSPVWPIIAIPTSSTCFLNCSSDKKQLNPSIDSNLSKVPPVWPRPLPDILATLSPHAATIGPSAIEVLSPTPPVECLSALIPGIDVKSITSPLFIIALAKYAVSSSFIPFKTIAIRRELVW